jgi:hypothetical protein
VSFGGEKGRAGGEHISEQLFASVPFAHSGFLNSQNIHMLISFGM